MVDHLQTYLPPGDARLRLTPAAVVEVVVANLMVGHRPVYALGEWAAAFDPGVLGLRAGDAEMLNDDRIGRTLDRLFDADRASLITATVLAVIRDFNVETAQLHNDSTTVTVTGVYPDAAGPDRGGKATPAIRHGHNKDFRPDLKQLLFILTICADGAVPIAYRLADGNTSDDPTHVPTCDQRRAWWARRGSCTSRTASSARNRPWATSPATVGARTPGFGTGRKPTPPHGRRPAAASAPDRVWRTFEAPAPSVDGYR
ncbi:MAG TPA: DUF4277 domain-containing protein [Nocardioidaceae bacterium]|nr:DUF4277 domain-containing protein [Nocardioidaceae bacterium]